MAGVQVVTTGGTIAMKDDEAAGGAIPAVRGRELVALLPEGVGAVEVEEYCNLPSAHFTLDTVWGIGACVAELAADDAVQGIVVTHGTDAMEETAYLLDLDLWAELMAMKLWWRRGLHASTYPARHSTRMFTSLSSPWARMTDS